MSRNSIGLLAALAMPLTAAPAAAGVITGTNNTIGLFDASSGTRSVTFTGAEAGFDSGVVQSVTISINFAKADGEAFPPPFPTGVPFFNEIVFRLTSPTGTTVNLIDAGSFNAGAAGTLFDGTITFDQSAAQVVNVNPNLPQAGTFRPVGGLGAFAGQAAGGTWTLFIQDTVGGDALRFRSFTLNVTTVGGGPGVVVPEPTGLALLGLGAVCGAGYRRLRRRSA